MGESYLVSVKKSVFREMSLSKDDFDGEPILTFESEDEAESWVESLDQQHSLPGRLNLHTAHPNDRSGVDAYLVFRPVGQWVFDS
jgi:hypothetical protein